MKRLVCPLRTYKPSEALGDLGLRGFGASLGNGDLLRRGHGSLNGRIMLPGTRLARAVVVGRAVRRARPILIER